MTWLPYGFIDPPNPFSPIEEMRDFIASNEADPHPQMQEEVAKVRRYLTKALEHHSMDDESPEKVLARNWSILGGLRGALKDKTLSVKDREDLIKLVSFTEATIEGLQRDYRERPMIQNVPTGTVVRNGAAFGAAVAVLRICWNWPVGNRLWPYSADTQLLYLYMVFWYAAAGAVIFVVARNVLNSIARK
jgi:hypothetical protein